MSSYQISKTSFIKHDQCPKAFFLYKNFPYLRDPISKEKQFTFNRGHEVGFLAQQLFPGGIDVSAKTKSASEGAQITQDLILNNTTIIYEATFIHNGVLVMVDILHFDGLNWNAYEVKSSLKISEIYVKDACLQYYVLKNSLPKFNDLYLVTLNGDYVLQNELNIQQLFKKRSVKTDGEKNLDYFKHKISDMHLLLEKNVTPEVPIGKQCFSPYTCDFMGTCWKNIISDKSVFNIGKSDKETIFNWYNAGYKTTDLVPPDNELKAHIKIQLESISKQTEYINKTEIKTFFNKINSNSCFMDMEVWSPAVPKFNGHKPFEQLPFLYSLCYRINEEIRYHHYIIPEGTNDLKSFIESLLESTATFRNVVVYDKNLELQVLAKIEHLLPEFSLSINELRLKMIDLADVVQNFYFYHPKFKGNFSLKAISELLDETADYNKLEVQSGIIAMYKYEGLLNEPNQILKEDLKQQLIDYCNLDTLTAMKFYEYLKERIKE